MEIVADHIRAATFVLGDPHGVLPSNVEQGYVLRRFIRRAIRHARLLGMQGAFIEKVAGMYVDLMSDVYPELAEKREHILTELKREEEKFNHTIEKV